MKEIIVIHEIFQDDRPIFKFAIQRRWENGRLVFTFRFDIIKI